MSSLTAEQLELRRHRLGASDMSTVLRIPGRPGGKSFARLVLEKRGTIEPVQIDEVCTRHGTFVEPFIRQEFTRATGLRVLDPDGSIIHPDHDWLLATPDGWVAEEGQPLVPIELKAIRYADPEDGWGPSGTDEFPAYYLVQCQTQLAVTGAPHMFGAVLIAGSELRWYRMPRSERLIQHIISEGAAFMDLVESGEDPNPETVDDCKIIWQFAKGPALDVTGEREFLDAVVTRQASKRAIKALEDQIDEAETLIRSMMEDREAAEVDGKPVVTWKQTKRGNRTFRVTKHGEELAELP